MTSIDEVLKELNIQVSSLKWQLDDWRRGFGELDEKYGDLMKENDRMIKYIKQLHVQITGLELERIMNNEV